MSILSWIESRGGPFIILPKSHLRSWLGAYLPADDLNPAELQTPDGGFYLSLDSSFGLTSTDYDRACAVGDIPELIDVGKVKGLVLGGEPLKTAWWSFPYRAGGVLVRWICANSEKKIIRDLERISENIDSDGIVRWETIDPDLLLIDAMDLGGRLEGDYLRITLPSGPYEISTHLEFGESKGTAMNLHVFRSVK